MRVTYPQLRYQLNENELEAFEVLLREVEYAESFEAFDVGIQKAQDMLDDDTSVAWFSSLREGMQGRMERVISEGEIQNLHNLFFNWFSDIESDYMDPIEDKIAGLQAISEGGIDTDALHMGWLVEMDSDLKKYLESPTSLNEADAFLYHWGHKFSGVSPEKFIELFDMRTKSNHLAMTMEQYINYYKKSLKNMDGDGFSHEASRNMALFLRPALEKGLEKDRMMSMLARKFKVHPAHRESLGIWCDKIIALDSVKNDLDDFGLSG